MGKSECFLLGTDMGTVKSVGLSKRNGWKNASYKEYLDVLNDETESQANCKHWQ